MTTGHAAATAVEAAARQHYGRLLAVLARRTRDPMLAEDVLSEAFASALASWPRTGVPDHPEAWLLATAKNELKQGWRHASMAEARLADVVAEMETLLAQSQAEPSRIPDERLRLLFVCAHPAIDRSVRSALMLQLVLGVDVPRMASAFLLSPATLAQRLVRAKSKIRLAGIDFDEPEPAEYASRVGDVIEAIYGAYSRSRHVADVASVEGESLAAEALHLSAMLVALLPREPEALGLRALLLYVESRRGARFDAAGAFVPLGEQEVARWDSRALGEAEALLSRASEAARPGPMQLEAAIQSAHCARRFGSATPWPVIEVMYRALVTHWPSAGASIGHAVALAETGKAEDAVALLDELRQPNMQAHSPYFAACAHVLALAGRPDEAARDYRRAAGLTAAMPVREWLLDRAAALSPPGTRPPDPA